MSAHLKLRIEEKVSYMEDIDNMNQLLSLMKLVTINTRPGPSSVECSGRGYPSEADNVTECRSNVKDANMPSQVADI